MINVDLFRTPRKANADGYQAIGIIHFDADEFGGSMNCPILRKDNTPVVDLNTLMVHVPKAAVNANAIEELSDMLKTICSIMWRIDISLPEASVASLNHDLFFETGGGARVVD